MTTQSKSALQSNLIIRHPVMDDVQAVVDLMNALTMTVIGENDESLDELRSSWGMPDANLETNKRLIFTPDGRLIGYGDVETDNPLLPFIDLYVHPDFENSGASENLVTWAEEISRQVIPRAQEGARVAMRAAMYAQDRWYKGLLESVGMQSIRHHWRMEIEMNEDPTPVEWPEGIQVRSFKLGEDMRPILHAVRDIWRDHWGYVEEPFEEHYAAWSQRWLGYGDFDPSLWFLAYKDKEIVGTSLCRVREVDGVAPMGWVSTLGVRREHRRNGLGMALLKHSFNAFYARGYKRVGLGVDASSLTGATRLYQKAGMQVVQQIDMYEKELRPGVDLTTQSVSSE